MAMNDCVREMTFEEEAAYYEAEARAEFAKENDSGSDSSSVNNILRRGMRIIRKAREEINRAYRKQCKETASLNYEAEYHRLEEAHKELCAKLACVTEECRAMETEFCRMRAQLDIVYLIFGKR